MGQNSTEVAYGFGQMGSVFQNLAKPVFPPKDHVIVAIQFLGDGNLATLETETLDTRGPQFPTHQDDELASAGGPDANYLGLYEAQATSATSAGVITLTNDVVGNKLIKPGQYVLIGADGDSIDLGLTLDTGAGHIDPIYSGPNVQGLIVKSLTGGTYGTTLTVTNTDGSVVDLSSIDVLNTLYFLDEFHGAGGTTIEAQKFPKGITIYGRWTKVAPGDADGVPPIICYFGK